MDRWKITLWLLVGTFLVGMFITFSIAFERGSRVVDADYYSHGLHYGKTSSGSDNPGLHWKLSASLARDQLQVCVRDDSGSPVCGGKLHFQPEQGSAVKQPTFALAESAPGVFSGPRPLSSTGELHGTLFFIRGEGAATHKVVLFNN